MRKLLLALVFGLLTLLPYSVAAQQGVRSHRFTIAGPDSAINLVNTAIAWHQLSWSVSGTASVCTVALDTSTNGTTWSAGGAITGQTCTSNGSSSVVNVSANYVRINVTALTVTAGSSVTVTWTGWTSNPAGGGGGSVSITGTSPIVVTPSPTTGTGVISCPTCGATVPGVTGPPTTGLLARYDFPVGDNPAAITDSSGNGNNGTGTVGTPPTINALTGGLVCNGAGVSVTNSAANGALTIAMYVQRLLPMVPSSGGYEALFEADTSGNQMGILLRQPLEGAQNTSTSNGVITLNLTALNTFLGTQVIILTYDTTDRIFINGTEASYLGTPTSSLGTPTEPFRICGGTGTWYSSNTIMLNFHMYDHVFSLQEIGQWTQWANLQGTNRGMPPTFTTNLTGSQLLCNGDSELAGNGGGALSACDEFPTMLNGTWGNVTNRAHGLEACFQNQGAGIDSYQYWNIPGAERRAMFLWLGTNDVAIYSKTAAATQSCLASYSSQVQTSDINVFPGTMMSRTGNDTFKNTLNTTLRSTWRQFSSGLCDIASDPVLGADGAYASTTYFVDGVHGTPTAIYNHQVPIIKRCINEYYGNQDFSTATAYGSAAPSAVATTAGSRSGTNTATITMAATPANCQVGNTAIIAGTTPVGYSSAAGWTILTRSSTQITVWTDASATDTITGQGTVVCPQQQDGDVATVLNFGAGNYTITSCLGQTGQRRKYLNINSGTSTLVDLFTAESIVGTATIAQNVVRVLESQLVSASAAGCTWAVVQ